MTIERRVRLFRNHRHQTVRIPHEFALPADWPIMRKEGDRLILTAASPRRLLEVLAQLSPLDEDFPPIVDPTPPSAVV